MIVVDSSVWVSNLRNVETASVKKLRAIVRSSPEEVIVGDIVVLEILQGARNASHAERIEQSLTSFQIVAMLGPGLAIRAADNYRLLRARGMTVRKTVDIIIGSFCIEHGHWLLHDDRDFTPMADHLGLQVI